MLYDGETQYLPSSFTRRLLEGRNFKVELFVTLDYSQ